MSYPVPNDQQIITWHKQRVQQAEKWHRVQNLLRDTTTPPRRRQWNGVASALARALRGLRGDQWSVSGGPRL